MMIEYGKARGMTPIDALHFITPVNGVMATNAKGIGFLLDRARYVFQEVHRAAFIYAGNGKEYISPRVLVPDEVTYKLDITPDEWTKMSDDKRARIAKFRDRITTIKYGFREPSGIRWEGEFSYYLSNALDAGLMEKETYQKYTGDMFLHRAKTGLSKVLGILTGSETEELAIEMGKNIDIVEGEIQIID